MLKTVILFIFISVILTQEAPPLLEGTWFSECYLVPTSQQIYQTRTLTFGIWDNELQSGTWTYTVNAFNSIDCNPNFQHYRTVYSGSYALTGKASEDLDLFWHVDYRLNSKTMEVFTNDFANYINDDVSCDITNIIPQTIMSIRHSNCETLQILPIEDCPVMYDVVRRFDSILWIGSQFPDEQFQWKANCQNEDRPKVADPYSFTLTTAVDDYDAGVNLDPYVGSTTVFGTSDFDRSKSDYGFTNSYNPVLLSSSGNALYINILALLISIIITILF